MRPSPRVFTAGVASLIFVLAAGVSQSQTPATHVVVPASQVKFAPIEIPGFASGTKIAVIYGDPNGQSGDYVLRLAFPDGYSFPAHWHPMAENLTVLEGSLGLGMGDTPDDTKLVAYSPGTFMHIPGKMPHFGTVKGATVIQLHGEAPFKIELAKPAATK